MRRRTTGHAPRPAQRQAGGARQAELVVCDQPIEQAHQQLKEELGLDHFEGRTWTGLHHHALLSLISFAFLQHLRLTASGGRGENPPAPRRPATRALAPGGAPRAAHAARRRPSALPHVPRATDVPAARARVDLAK